MLVSLAASLHWHSILVQCSLPSTCGTCAPGNATYAECWGKQFKEALLNVGSTSDVADRNLQIAFERLFKNEQVLVFDECHVLFACPEFYQQFLKTPPYLKRRPMILLLSAASEMQSVQGQTFTTPTEITAKHMWTPLQ